MVDPNDNAPARRVTKREVAARFTAGVTLRDLIELENLRVDMTPAARAYFEKASAKSTAPLMTAVINSGALTAFAETMSLTSKRLTSTDVTGAWKQLSVVGSGVTSPALRAFAERLVVTPAWTIDPKVYAVLRTVAGPLESEPSVSVAVRVPPVVVAFEAPTPSVGSEPEVTAKPPFYFPAGGGLKFIVGVSAVWDLLLNVAKTQGRVSPNQSTQLFMLAILIVLAFLLTEGSHD